MIKRLIVFIVCFSFILSNLQYVNAQTFNVNELPAPGVMVNESEAFAPLALKGLVVDPQKPLKFQFIVDTGSSNVIPGIRDQGQFKQEAVKLIKYFLAGLTIPEGDLWVNLSPYEKDRITPSSLGQTELGRDLLAQDYILKQLTASLIYPEKDLGKEFWGRVYARAQEQFGTTDIPVNTFNKVWILSDQAQVFENGSAAYVTKATLKVMLDEDYLSMQKHNSILPLATRNETASIGANIIRQIILPEIEKEVNTGKNFAPLRQIYDSMILAKWYKETIRNGLLDALYINKEKTNGVDLADPAVKEQIYQRYLQAYKKGVFNFIKEDPMPDGQSVPRKYFSGGLTPMPSRVRTDGAMSAVTSDGAMLRLDVDLQVQKDAAMSQDDDSVAAAEALARERLEKYLAGDGRSLGNQAVDLLFVLGSGNLKVPERAAEFVLQHHPKWVLISGGHGIHEGAALRGEFESEAHVFRNIMVEKGVSPDTIIIEDQSRHTGENVSLGAKRLSEVIPGFFPRTVALMTSPLLEKRAVQIMKNGLNGAFSSVKDIFETPAYQINDESRMGISQQSSALAVAEIARMLAYPRIGWAAPINIPVNVVKDALDLYDILSARGDKQLLSEQRIENFDFRTTFDTNKAIKALTPIERKAWIVSNISKIKIFIFDVDGTLKRTIYPMDQTGIKELLIKLLKFGYPVGIISMNKYENAYDGVIKHIPSELRRNVTIYTAKGMEPRTFDEKGREVQRSDLINKANIISPENFQIFRKVIDDLIGQYRKKIELDTTKANFPAFFKPEFLDGKQEPSRFDKGLEIRTGEILSSFGVINMEIAEIPSSEHAVHGKSDMRDDFIKDLKVRLPDEIRDAITIEKLYAGRVWIHPNEVGKRVAMAQFLNSYTPEEIMYFGDGFDRKGKDFPLHDMGINNIAVNKDRSRIPDDINVLFSEPGVLGTAAWLKDIVEVMAEHKSFMREDLEKSSDLAMNSVGQWDYKGITLDSTAQILTIHNATRIPDNKEEFLKGGQNSPRDIVLRTRNLNDAEKIIIKGLKDQLGLSEEIQVFQKDSNAVNNKMFGISHDGVLYVREDLVFDELREDDQILGYISDKDVANIKAEGFSGELGRLFIQLIKRNELLDAYDENGIYIGVKTRGEVYSKPGNWVGIADVVAIGPDGQVILQRRSPTASTSQGIQTVHGGHIEVGERPIDAAVRELKEEIGVSADPLRFIPVGHERMFRMLEDDSVKNDGIDAQGRYVSNSRVTGRVVNRFMHVYVVFLTQVEVEQAKDYVKAVTERKGVLAEADEIVETDFNDLVEDVTVHPEKYTSGIKYYLTWDKSREIIYRDILLEAFDAPSLRLIGPKYFEKTPDGFKVSPTFGVGVIHMIGNSEDAEDMVLQNKLAVQAEAFFHQLGPSLRAKIARLDLKSFHITVAAVLTAEDLSIRRRMLNIISGFMDNLPQEFQVKISAQVVGIDMFVPNVIKFKVKWDQQFIGRFMRAMEGELRKDTEVWKAYQQLPDYKTKNSVPHISIGYIMSSLTPEEIDELTRAFGDASALDKAINFHMNVGQMAGFSDLNTFFPLRILKNERAINTLISSPNNIYNKSRRDVDSAQNGGIDLNQINVNRTGNTIKVNFDPAQLKELLQENFKGFAPVITSIIPISSPFQLLGINTVKEQEL